MPAFTYPARALNGDLRTATIEAPNRDEGVAQLRRQRLNVVKIDEASVAKKKKGGKIKMRDIVIFTGQSSTMINAGLPLVQALEAEGWAVFCDRTIPPGDTWRTYISSRLRRAPVVIVPCSPHQSTFATQPLHSVATRLRSARRTADAPRRSIP